MIFWGYFVELFLAGSLLVLVKNFLKTEAFLKIFDGTEAEIAGLVGGIVLAGSLAFLWTFFSKSDTDFYRWLADKKAFKPYVYGTAYTVFVSFICTIYFIFVKNIKNELSISVAFFILFLTIINLITFFNQQKP
jgi:uncharacterized membrane protein YbaN (DUF454 family)